MSTTSVRRKPTTHTDRHYVVGKTFEEVCAQEVAAHDRRVDEIIKEMSRPQAGAKPAKKPK